MINHIVPNRNRVNVNTRKLFVFEFIAILLCIPLGVLCAKVDYLSNISTEIIIIYVPLSILVSYYLSLSKESRKDERHL